MRRTSLATKCAGIRKNVRIFYEFTLDSPADFRHKEAQKETSATECVLLELLRSTVRGKITLAMSLPKFAHADKSKAYHLMGCKTKTLCGLSVLPVLFDDDRGAPLHLVKNPPLSCSICKHCIRAQREAELSATDETDHQWLKTA